MKPKTAELWNPITEKQNWQNEFGFIDSFNQPTISPTTEGLQRGAIGLGAGAAAGGLTGRNPWLTGVNTGVGSLAGYLLANTLAKGNPNAGDRSAYETLGATLGGGAGLGLSMFMRDKRRDDNHKALNIGIPLPGGAQLSLKTAGILNSIQAQLPEVRLPDTIAGAGAGALGGLAYNALKDDEDATPTEKRRRTWGRLIGGAGLGALGSNLIGDRFRRYMSNKIYPVGYSPTGVKDQLAKTGPASEDRINLMPRNFRDVWEGAILDKPLQPAVREFERGEYKPAYTEDKRLQWDAGSLTANTLAMRRELLRRGLGVHSDNPLKDIWLKQPDGTVSLNPKHPHVNELLKEVMLPNPKVIPDETGKGLRQLVTDPLQAISDTNSAEGANGSLMGEITGGQRISLFPYAGAGGSNDYLAKINDRWDFGLDSGEKAGFKKFLTQKYLKPGKAQAPVNQGYRYAPEGAAPEEVSSAYQKSMMQRLALEHLLLKEAPWVSQRAYLRKLPTNFDNPGVDTGYAFIPSTASGQLYPGESVSTWNPLFEDTLSHRPKDILNRLKNNSYVPEVPSK